MGALEDLKEYIFNELPQRLVLIQRDEAIGEPNTSPLDKVKNAPVGTQYLRSDVIPHELYVKVQNETTEDWTMLGNVETKVISFQFFNGTTNMEKIVIPFPYLGRIIEIKTAVVDVDMLGETEITIEKISSSDFETGGAFTSILDSNIIIPINSKTGGSYIVSSDILEYNDILRCFPVKQSLAKNITIQIKCIVRSD